MSVIAPCSITQFKLHTEKGTHVLIYVCIHVCIHVLWYMYIKRDIVGHRCCERGNGGTLEREKVIQKEREEKELNNVTDVWKNYKLKLCSLIVYMWTCHGMITCAYIMVCVWRSEDNVQETMLSFYHMDPSGTIPPDRRVGKVEADSAPLPSCHPGNLMNENSRYSNPLLARPPVLERITMTLH